MTFGLPPPSFGLHEVVVVIRKMELDGTASAVFLEVVLTMFSGFSLTIPPQQGTDSIVRQLQFLDVSPCSRVTELF